MGEGQIRCHLLAMKCLRNDDRGQATAVIEGPIPNASDALWNVDQAQASAAPEGCLPNAGDALWDDD